MSDLSGDGGGERSPGEEATVSNTATDLDPSTASNGSNNDNSSSPNNEDDEDNGSEDTTESPEPSDPDSSMEKNEEDNSSGGTAAAEALPQQQQPLEHLEMESNTTELQQQQQQQQQHPDPPEEKSDTHLDATTLSPQSASASQSPENDEDDVTSKAAVALAAVAAAATANHKSPAEAAAQARAVAQTFLTNTTSGDDGSEGDEEEEDGAPTEESSNKKKKKKKRESVWKRVRFSAVQAQLQQSVQRDHDKGESPNVSDFCKHLILHSDNACFLQHLLLLEYFQCTNDDEDEDEMEEETDPAKVERGDDPPEVKTTTNLMAAASPSLEEETPHELAQIAAERLLSVLKKLEGAYDSLRNLLPHRHGASHNNNTATSGIDDLDALLASTTVTDDANPNSGDTSGFAALSSSSPSNATKEDYETSVVVPDLLPPCTTAKGDSTLAFFRACTAREPEPQPTIAHLPGGGSGGESSSRTVTTTTTSKSELSDTEARLVAAHKAQHPPAAKHANSSSLTGSSPGRTAVSMFGSMFKRSSSDTAATHPKDGSAGGSLTKSTASTTATAFLNTFRRKSKTSGTDAEDPEANNNNKATPTDPVDPETSGLRPGEYVVKIERDMLGLTVENVLERTVVRTVLAGGPAKKAGAKVGSLIVKVGNIETRNLTHFETIDELRQSQRPLLLVLKQLSEDSLRAAREEMGRLIRGAGFGTIMDGGNVTQNPPTNRPSHEGTTASESGGDVVVRPLIAADLRLDAFTTFLRRRLSSAHGGTAAGAPHHGNNKKEEGVARAADKLIWILTLFVFGLEREVQTLPAVSSSEPQPTDRRHSASQGSHLYQHTLKEYTDSAKSAAKVLLDYTKKRIDPNGSNGKGGNHPMGAMDQQPRRRKGGPPPPPVPLQQAAGRGAGLRRGKGNRAGLDASNIAHEKPLLQIGDVLQRTRAFLADTTSPPAALLRGEVIALLCDILDVDTEMELSEEESVSATSGAQAGPINDLGSAGSLLKLIVLNCPIMRSPICEELSDSLAASGDSEWAEELRRKLGTKEKYSSHELHRLHAGNRFLAVVHRLAASRSMSARITACSLGPVIWGHLDFPHQLQLRGVITRALHDVEVMVRKATANVLHEIAELVFDARCVPWLVLMCERSMTDPEPQMRSAAMTLTWHLAEHLPNTFQGDASQGSRYLRRLPDRSDPIFADVYLLQCKLLPVATRLAEDRSPSVRLAVAAQCDRLCDALGDHWSSVVIDVLLGLLSDPDERVRCEAVMCVPRLAGIVLLSSPPGASVSEVSILEALVPASIRLQGDAVAVVRVALASAAGELLTLLVALQSRAEEALPPNTDAGSGLPEGFRRYKKQVDERLIPLVQTLLNDQDPEVTSAALRAVTNASRRSTSHHTQRHRHQSMGGVDDDSASVTSLHSHASRENRQPVFMPVLSEVQVLRLLPTLSELADSKQWRVRQSAVEIVPALLGCTQKLETRTEISKLCARLMSDKVDEVRKTAAECLCMGGSSLGSHGEDASSEWFQRIVIPAIRDCAAHQNSKQRLLSLKMVEIVLLNGACPTKARVVEPYGEGTTEPESPTSSAGSPPLSPMSELVSIALSLRDDRIANVRLNVGRILESVLHVLSSDDLGVVVEHVEQQLANEQENAKDRDVIFFASRCATKAKAAKEEMGSEVGSTL